MVAKLRDKSTATHLVVIKNKRLYMLIETKPVTGKVNSAGIKPQVIKPSEAESAKAFGWDVKMMATSQETGGTFAAFVWSLKPGEGPRPHWHAMQDEYFYVLSGTYSLVLGGEECELHPGELAFVPRGFVHTFKNSSQSVGQLLEWSIPGINGDWFTAISQAQASGQATPELIA